MIEFTSPPISTTISQYMRLVQLWKACSTCVGFCIGLGDAFFSDGGVNHVDNTILPTIISHAAEGISPRVLPSYAILLWFAQQVRESNKTDPT